MLTSGPPAPISSISMQACGWWWEVLTLPSLHVFCVMTVHPPGQTGSPELTTVGVS